MRYLLILFLVLCSCGDDAIIQQELDRAKLLNGKTELHLIFCEAMKYDTRLLTHKVSVALGNEQDWSYVLDMRQKHSNEIRKFKEAWQRYIKDYERINGVSIDAETWLRSEGYDPNILRHKD